MTILLGLLAALTYGASDFAAGLASRRLGTGAVTCVVMLAGLVVAAVALAIVPGAGPNAHVLVWGALSGVGSALGSLALYRGLAVGQMSVVAPLATVVTALLPVLVGIGLGEHLSAFAIAGIVLAFPAIALVSFAPGHVKTRGMPKGLVEAVLAGAGFGFLFIALNMAGTGSGAWPLVPGQALAFLLVLPFAGRGLRRGFEGSARLASLLVAAGVLSGIANLLFLMATGGGELTIVAVLTALYPAVTVLLARFILHERWSRLQIAGLLASAAAVVLIALG